MNYYCPFCQQRCHKNAWDSEWVYCNPCKIRYRDWRPEYIIHSVTLDDRKYEIQIDQRTKIVEIITDKEDLSYYIGLNTEKVILCLDFPISGLTPDNAAQKLKTLLVFL